MGFALWLSVSGPLPQRSHIGRCFGFYERGPFALFADINEPQNYDVKAILLMINPMKLYMCSQAKYPI